MLRRAFDYARDFWRRKGPKTRLEKFIVYGSALFSLVGMPACAVALATVEPEYFEAPAITYVNDSNGLLHVYVDGTYQASLSPGEAYTDEYFYWRGDVRLFEGIDREGRVAFAVNLTRSELDAMDWRIVIRDDG